MKRVTIRVPATTANLGPGFDAFGCALSLYTDVTFEETDCGLEITGCPEEFTGPDNLAYESYCAVLASRSEEVRGVKIPANLSGLQQKKELHTGVIEKTAILDFVMGL